MLTRVRVTRCGGCPLTIHNFTGHLVLGDHNVGGDRVVDFFLFRHFGAIGAVLGPSRESRLDRANPMQRCTRNNEVASPSADAVIPTAARRSTANRHCLTGPVGKLELQLTGESAPLTTHSLRQTRSSARPNGTSDHRKPRHRHLFR